MTTDDKPTPEAGFDLTPPEAIVLAGLYPTGLYPDRHGGHYLMGPPELYPCCGGRGWYHAENGERYCKGEGGVRLGCRAGDEKRRVD
jgi:hypothetical protein